MRLFWELVSLSFRRQLTYRAAHWAGLMTNVFFGLLRATVLLALYGSRSEVAGISAQDAVTYSGLTQAVIAYLSLFGWYDLMNSIYTGQVAGDLLKPLRYLKLWLAVDLGRASASLLLRGVTIMVLYGIVVNITVPTHPLQWLALVVALTLGWLVSFSWRFLVNLSAFWSPNASGVGRFAFGIAWILSGFFMPLRYYPDWFRQICAATPFPAMVNTTVEVYLGLLRGPDLLWALGTQLAWALFMMAIAGWVLRRGVHRLVIQGG